ncbi:hypothetical protein FRC07_000661 [Ceratobasidium sp. 392]|nr:hypothetical protein FRC07_000661 [Ceratobasidium sp. 392]
MGISTIWALRRRPVSQLFYDFGIHCATHQIRVILICGLVITSLFYPAITIHFSHQPLSHFSTRILDSLFLPSANDAFHHNDLHDIWQGYDALRIRTDAATRARCGTEHTVRVERLFVPSTTPDPFGALNIQTLIPTLDLQLKLEKHLTPELPCVRLLDNTTPSTPPSHRCLVVSPTTHWNDDVGLIRAEPHLYSALNKAHRNVSRGGIPLTAEMELAGRLTTDHAGYGSIIESSKFLSVSFFFREDDCHSNAGHDAWSKLVEDLVPPETAVIKSRDQPKLLALEFAVWSQPYSSWVSVGLYLVYLVLFVQLSGSMRRMDSVHSRFGLTFTGMVEILASTITSVSVCAIAGFRVTMVPWSILPIVIVIVGAENMFVLMEAVLATPISLPVRRRIAEGLQKAGVSITIKLITYNAVLGTIAYFASGAIRQFCVFVIVVLVAHWFLIHTFFLAVLSIDLQRLEARAWAYIALQLSDVLRQGGAVSPSTEHNAPNQRNSRSRFGFRMGFKTKAARNISLMLVLSITGGLYYFSGPYAASRLRDPIASFDNHQHTQHHLTPTQSVSTPFTAPSSPQFQAPPVPTTPASPSTSMLIWRTLNPPNDPLVHLRIEQPILVLFPPPPGSNISNEKTLNWSHRIRQLRPILWTLKVLVLPIGATLAALYGLLLHLLRNAELRAAQRDRIDSLVEGEAEEREREEEEERKKSESSQVEASFSSQASIFLREDSTFVAFLHPDGQLDVQQRVSGASGSISYVPLMSLSVPGIVAVDVCEWSLGPLVATLTASGHAAVWDSSCSVVIEMDLGLPPDQQPLFSASVNDVRICLLPTPTAPLPCRRCGLPAASSFTLAFSWALAPSYASTIYLRRASVLYQTGRCSCQPLSIASTLAGPRVISFGLHSGVRVVSGLGAGGPNSATTGSEFPVSVHGLRRSSSSYGRQSFESTSSMATEDFLSEPSKDGSGLLAPPMANGKENGHGLKLGSGSDVRWEQHAIEESCERGQWDVVGTHIVGIRRKSRKSTDKGTSTGDVAAKSDQLPDAVLERWEVWQVDTATHDLPTRTSILSRLCGRTDSPHAGQVSGQSDGTTDPQRSLHMARILRLGRAAGSRSPSLSPQTTGSRTPNDSRGIPFPRLPFTRVSSTSTSHDGLYAAFGNTIGVVRLVQPVSNYR